MPHVYKDVPNSQLHQLALLDRSPVQTPLHTAAHSPASTPSQGSPSTSRASTPTVTPVDRTEAVECMSIPHLSLLMNDHGFADTPFIRIPNKATTTVNASLHRAPDFKGSAAHGVRHLDRSPVQTAYNTRSHSPVNKIRENKSYESIQSYESNRSAGSFSDHDEQQAGEVVKALNERVVQLGLNEEAEKTPTKSKKSN